MKKLSATGKIAIKFLIEMISKRFIFDFKRNKNTVNDNETENDKDGILSTTAISSTTANEIVNNAAESNSSNHLKNLFAILIKSYF